MNPEPAFSRRHKKNLCRPYGARFRYKTLTQGFRPGLHLFRPPGWICQDIQCIVITARVAAKGWDPLRTKPALRDCASRLAGSMRVTSSQPRLASVVSQKFEEEIRAQCVGLDVIALRG